MSEPEPLIKDGRGWKLCIPFNEDKETLYVMSAKGGMTRGGDRHKTEQMVMLISGKAAMVLKTEQGEVSKELIRPLKWIVIPAMVSHAFIFLEDSLLVEILPRPFEGEYDPLMRMMAEATWP